MSYVYRMSYPIENENLRTSQVINQALLVFPEDAEERGIRVLGAVNAWIDGPTVTCEAAAEPIEGRRVRSADLHGWRVVALHSAGFNDRQIGEELGIALRTARNIRVELGLPAVERKAA